MSRVLLTGGTGFIGTHLRRALHEDEVILLGPREPVLASNETWTRLDLREPIALEVAGGTLCHLAYVRSEGHQNVAYNRRLLEAVNRRTAVEHVILVSSISVYGSGAAAVVDEESPCNPAGDYGRSKLACEAVWREGLREDCALTVLRPTEVVGVGGKGLLSLIRDALHRPVVVAAAKRALLYHRPLHYVAVGNVVAAIRFCCNRPRSFESRETLIVSDDHQPENRSYAAMQDAVRAVVGRAQLPVPAAPRWAVATLGAGVGYSPPWLPEAYSSYRIRAAGFKDAVALGDQVRSLVESVEAPPAPR